MIQFAIVMAVVLLFVVGLVAGLGQVERMFKKPDKEPEELLRERFALGEIDEAEYARRLAVLEMGPMLELD